MASRPQWRGQRDTRGRMFKTLVVLSVLLHVPLTPLGALLGLLSLLGSPETPDTPDLGEIEGIPISLLSDDELESLGVPSPARGEAAPSEPAAAEPTAPPEPAAPDEDDLAALFDDEPPEEPDPPETKPAAERRPPSADAGVRAESPPSTPVDGGAPLATAPPDAGAPAPAAPKAISDPGALAGAAASVSDPNANVKLLLLNGRIAEHPARPRIGALLRRVPQWKSFFGPSGLDPIRDLSRVYVAGPQFRESAEVVAVLEYGVEEAVMKKAIDAIVERKPKGAWLDTPIPAARARADRAQRTFILPRPGIVIMVPPRLTDDTISKARQLRFPSITTDAAVVAFINTPWRMLIGLNAPVKIPDSIATLRVEVVPSADGGIRIRVHAKDGSPEQARSNAEVLERAINLLTQRDMGLVGSLLFGSSKIELIKPIELRAEGDAIVGTAEADARQVDRMLNFVESWLDAIENRQRIEERKTAPPPSSASAAPKKGEPTPPAPTAPGAASAPPSALAPTPLVAPSTTSPM